MGKILMIIHYLFIICSATFSPLTQEMKIQRFQNLCKQYPESERNSLQNVHISNILQSIFLECIRPTDWLAQKQDNLSKRGDMPIHRLLFQ
jgi:hypothetical protein